MRTVKNIIGWFAWLFTDLHAFFHRATREDDLWVRVWGGKDYRLAERTCKRDAESILVFLKLAQSRTEAQRLIKAGAIEFSECWSPDGVWRRLKLKEALPPGRFLWVRRGQRLYGIETILLPTDTQRFPTWAKLLGTD